ncbi:Hypothetical predicted protein [Cloeon dipterum]|nr:Hypothetical predicted protein [Cloeon dipterum]
MRQQINCLLDRGFCDNQGNLMKGLAGYFIKSRCGSCDGPTRQAYNRVTEFLSNNYRREWRELQNKYSH